MHSILKNYLMKAYSLKINKGKGNSKCNSALILTESTSDYSRMINLGRILLDTEEELRNKYGRKLIKVGRKDEAGDNFFVKGEEIYWVDKKWILIKPFKNRLEIKKDAQVTIHRRFYVNGFILSDVGKARNESIEDALRRLMSRLAWRLKDFGEIETIFLKELKDEFQTVKCYVSFTSEESYKFCLASMEKVRGMDGVYKFDFEEKTLEVRESVDSQLESFAFSRLPPKEPRGKRGNHKKKRPQGQWHEPRQIGRPNYQVGGLEENLFPAMGYPFPSHFRRNPFPTPRVINRGRLLHHSPFVHTHQPIGKDILGRDITEELSLLRIAEPTSSFTREQFNRHRPELSHLELNPSSSGERTYFPFRPNDRHFALQFDDKDSDLDLSKRHRKDNVKFNHKI